MFTWIEHSSDSLPRIREHLHLPNQSVHPPRAAVVTVVEQNESGLAGDAFGIAMNLLQ